MKNFLLSMLLGVSVLSGCEKEPERLEPCDCEIVEEDMLVDFSYGYHNYYISANDASVDVPAGSINTWNLNGEYMGDGSGFESHVGSNGLFSISLCVTSPSGKKTCSSQQLEIRDGEIVTNEPQRADTAKVEVDFSYSVILNEDASYAIISMADLSKVEHYREVSYLWTVNGNSVSTKSYGSETVSVNGDYLVSLKLWVDDVMYSKAEIVEVTGIQ